MTSTWLQLLFRSTIFLQNKDKPDFYETKYHINKPEQKYQYN